MRLFVAFFLLAAATASAQFSIPNFAPSECVATAIETAIPGANDGQVVAIACAGLKVPVLGSELYLGIDMDKGTAPLWYYVVYSKNLDTMGAAPLVRLTGVCGAPPIDDVPEFSNDGEFGMEGIPNGYIEGSALVQKIKDNEQYQGFHAAHPDSLPSTAMLSVSQEDFGTYPAGTPFWVFFWASNQQGTLPFICYTHAITGETICMGGTTESVTGEKAIQAGYNLFPNPSAENTMLGMPISMLGKSVQVEAIDVTGRRVLLATDLVTSIPMMLNTSMLSTGMWSVQVTSGTNAYVIPLVITH